jgi:hypothetical protein
MTISIKNEDEWFAKYEIQMIRDAKRKKEQSESKKSEGENEQPSNYMLCPKDGTKLESKGMGSVNIDICPKCDGIWLDRGELEEIITASSAERKTIFRKIAGLK